MAVERDAGKVQLSVLGKGHMSMLPVGAAYKFSAPETCTILIQSIDGQVTAHKWAEFCQH